MTRKGISLSYSYDSLPAPAADLGTWLSEQAPKAGDPAYLLAFADDGIIWGYISNNQVHLSSEAFPTVSPPLREETLQQAHLFGPTGEVRLWRSPHEGWQAVLIQDQPSEQEDALDEFYFLWGAPGDESAQGFTLLLEKGRGFRQAVPLTDTAKVVKLHVRHYLAYDDTTGSAYIALSRLVSLEGGAQ